MDTHTSAPIATLSGEFNAATLNELRSAPVARRGLALINQKILFPHRGRIELTQTHLALGSWKRLSADEIVQVTVDYVAEYTRFAAGGTRGGFPSFGNVKRLGAPLLLDLTSGERLVVLIDFTFWSGANKAADWEPALRQFIAHRN